jgi:hypothetical protein
MLVLCHTKISRFFNFIVHRYVKFDHMGKGDLNPCTVILLAALNCMADSSVVQQF